MKKECERMAAIRLPLAGCLAVACSLALACDTQPAPAERLQMLAPPEATAKAATPAPDEPRTAPPQTAETPPVFHTATGRLAAYDPRTRLVTVEAATGTSQYRVASDARVWMGRRRLSVSDLAKHLGAQTTVAFNQTDGVRATHTVRLADAERRSH